MQNGVWLSMALAAGIFSLTGTALGHSEYVQYVPNGTVNLCGNCHPGGNELALNLFGQETQIHVDKPVEDWWPAMQELDSDGDGQTNGQELGDPCGDWLIGMDPPRTTSISNPGDAADVSADPDNPPCDPVGQGGAGGAPATTSGGSAGAGQTTGEGGDNPGGGQGGDNPSSGAGRADPPLATPGSCSFSALNGSAWDFGAAGAAIVFLLASRRSRTPRGSNGSWPRRRPK